MVLMADDLAFMDEKAADLARAIVKVSLTIPGLLDLLMP
jgi:hypothetical protein